jgi:pyridoxine 5-phosphate synthase
MIQLSVNINKIALIRNSREGNNPNLIDYALRCIDYGGQGITVHPRPDQRHIRAEDCLALKNAINGAVEFNIEGNPFAKAMASNRSDVSDYPGFLEIVRQCKPEQCTLVPDSDSQLTSDHGFDLVNGDNGELTELIQELKQIGSRVSLFMDADCAQVEQAKNIGADRIELYTGPFAWASDLQQAFIPYQKAAETALKLELGINAGHDLNLENLPLFATLPGLSEVSIGHAITVDALDMGLKPCIAAYLKALQ